MCANGKHFSGGFRNLHLQISLWDLVLQSRFCHWVWWSDHLGSVMGIGGPQVLLWAQLKNQHRMKLSFFNHYNGCCPLNMLQVWWLISVGCFNSLSTSGKAVYGTGHLGRKTDLVDGLSENIASASVQHPIRKFTDYLLGLVSNGALRWRSWYHIAHRIEWNVQKTQWLNKI